MNVQNPVPGKSLQAQAQDARIPVLLIQRSAEANCASSSAAHTPTVHGWTVIIPQGWAMPFFSSLIFTGTRVGGQRERQTQAFESGVAYFPCDYPCTLSYDEYSDLRASREQEQWERKPPAKRPNYSKLGSRSPWEPDWDVVLGLRDPPVEGDPAGDDSTIPGEFLPAQRDMDIDTEDSARPEAPSGSVEEPAAHDNEIKIEPWLLQGPNMHATIEAITGKLNPVSGLFEQIDKLRQKRGMTSLTTIVQPNDLWKNALVRVRLRLCGRGCPEDLAVIHGMEDDEAVKWIQAEQLRKKGASLNTEEIEGETEVRIPWRCPNSMTDVLPHSYLSWHPLQTLSLVTLPQAISPCRLVKALQ